MFYCGSSTAILIIVNSSMRNILTVLVFKATLLTKMMLNKTYTPFLNIPLYYWIYVKRSLSPLSFIFNFNAYCKSPMHNACLKFGGNNYLDNKWACKNLEYSMKNLENFLKTLIHRNKFKLLYCSLELVITI